MQSIFDQVQEHVTDETITLSLEKSLFPDLGWEPILKEQMMEAETVRLDGHERFAAISLLNGVYRFYCGYKDIECSTDDFLDYERPLVDAVARVVTWITTGTGEQVNLKPIIPPHLRRASRASGARVERVFIDSMATPVLFKALESLLATPIDHDIVAKVYSDFTEDQVNSKLYTFSSGSELRISGEVEEHEPESLWVLIEGAQGFEDKLAELFEAYEFAFGSGAGYRHIIESLDIFSRTTKHLIDPS